MHERNRGTEPLRIFSKLGDDAVEGLAELPVSAGPAAALKSTVTQTANEDADATDAVPDHVRRLVSISRFAATAGC